MNQPPTGGMQQQQQQAQPQQATFQQQQQPAPPLMQQQQPAQGMQMASIPVQMGHGQNMQQGQMAGGMMMQPGPAGGGMQMAGGAVPMGGGRADALEEVLGPFPCVRLRGMPFEATVDDVLRFFQGLTVVDVVMILRGDGRGAGEALVLFANHMDLNMALSRDKQHMGRRYIEIFQSKRADYYHAVVGHLQHMDPRMGGPHGHHSYRNGPHMMHQQGHNPQHHHGGGGGSGGGAHHAGGQHGGPAAAGQPAVAPLLQSQGSGSAAATGQAGTAEHTGVIRMRGLPFSATKADVVNFFQGLNVLDESVQFVVRGDGRVTGEAFVTLSSPAEAEAAMQRNGSNMGSRYIELFPSAIEEAARHTSRHH